MPTPLKTAKPRGFQLRPEEVGALEAAYAQWGVRKKMRDAFPLAAAAPDRARISQLWRAADELQRQMEGLFIGGQTPEASILLCRMQELEGFRSGQWAYRKQLEDMLEPLRLLVQVGRMEGRGRGRPVDDFAKAWVFTAALHWQRAVNKSPSSSSTGRFVQALLLFRRRDLPKLSQRNIETGVAAFRDSPESSST